MSTIFYQFLWRPYMQNEISQLIVIDIPLVARAIAYIICFTTIEIYKTREN